MSGAGVKFVAYSIEIKPRNFAAGSVNRDTGIAAMLDAAASSSRRSRRNLENRGRKAGLLGV